LEQFKRTIQKIKEKESNMKKDKEIKWVVDSEVTEMFPPQSYEDLEKEIKTLKEKLIIKRKQINYMKKNNLKRKGKENG
tara:strand:- start:2652 stop:2888 length:237 start_codon:yes stop_codon:yes gene_type:complete